MNVASAPYPGVNPFGGVKYGQKTAWDVLDSSGQVPGQSLLNTNPNPNAPQTQGYNSALHGPVQSNPTFTNANNPTGGQFASYDAAGNAVFSGGSPTGPGGATGNNSIDSLIQGYLNDVKTSDAANTNRYNSAADYLKSAGTGYTNDPTTKGTNSLVQKFLQNPDVLDKATQQRILNQTDNTIQAQRDNGLTNTNNILAASGDNDSSTMAAAAQAADRNAIGQMGNANTNMGIQAAQLNNQSMQNAIGAGQRMSAQNAQVPLSIGQSLIGNLPQQRPNDPSGIAALMLAAQNQNFMQQNANNQQYKTPSTGSGPMLGNQNAYYDPRQQISMI